MLIQEQVNQVLQEWDTYTVPQKLKLKEWLMQEHFKRQEDREKELADIKHDEQMRRQLNFHKTRGRPKYVPEEVPEDEYNYPDADVKMAANKPQTALLKQLYAIKSKESDKKKDISMAGLNGNALWVKPRQDALSEAAHYNMSVNDICHQVDQTDQVKRFRQSTKSQ